MSLETYQDQIARLYHHGEIIPMAVGSPHVKDITLQVTDDCSMACTYCYQTNKAKHHMSFDTARRFIDLLLEPDEGMARYCDSWNTWGVALNFIGGEPLLEIDLIDRVTDYFIRRMVELDHPWLTRYMLGICTNGLAYFHPRVQRYLRRHRDHLSLSITVDGSKAIHDACRVDLAGRGTYDRVIAAVRHYRDVLGGYVGSKVTIAPGNLAHLSQAIPEMVAEGYREINLNCVYEDVWRPEHPPVLYTQLKAITDYLDESGHLNDVELSIFSKHCGSPISPEDDANWCGGTGLMLSVDWDGNIYPCQRYSEASITGREPYTLGTLDRGMLRDPADCRRLKCLECITRRSQSTDECWACPVAQGCGWCTAYHYELFGTPDRRATYICGMHKARSLANVYYWAKRGQPVPLYLPDRDALGIVDARELDALKAAAAPIPSS